MRSVKNYIFLIFLGIAFGVTAQKADPSRELEAIIESIAENAEEGTGATLIVEDLEELAETPLNINAATREELSKLHVLNDIQIQKLLDYRSQFGPVYSIFELNSIDGFSPALLQQIEPFLIFGKVEKRDETFSAALKYGRHQWLARTLATTQTPKGYLPHEDGTVPFEGNRARYYSRYRFQSGDRISAGFTAEKDPGEAFFTASNRKGFDFYSGHLSLKINSVIQNVTVGDFIVRSGQGLVLWQGYSTGKSVYTLDISKTNQGIRPFTSVDENHFFRGIATTLALGNAKISLFYSQKNDDGNRVFTDTSGVCFTSLQTSGYHRTVSEIADEKSVGHTNVGAVLGWRFNNLKIGATFLRETFAVPLTRSNQLYNRFRFSGTENITTGADYLFSKGKYQLFGEAAISKSKGKAFLQGAIVSLNDQLTLSMLFRHFDKNYHALWANTFAEGSSTNNETGMYLGMQMLPVKFVTLSAYSDFYHSQWITFTTAGPARGWDVFAQVDFRPLQNFEFYLRYKNEEKERRFVKSERYVNLPERNQKIRLHFQWKPTAVVTLKTRVEQACYKGLKKENGWMLFQDVQFAPAKVPLSLSARVAWFNTGSYNTRIYAYENDLLYTFSIPAYYGKGVRTYLNLKYKISKKLDCWFKIANTAWNDRETISSGYNEIAGNNKTELKFQLRLKI
ncbi:MAG: helix-hairpin-helix domain-containing protein [Prolixibacteraceae bacterium]|nr:helix-hairpin-helix domain-containing protein [Prolixibacteraceae bacterium]